MLAQNSEVDSAGDQVQTAGTTFAARCRGGGGTAAAQGM